MPKIPLVEDESIYIDCNPIDIIGNEVEEKEVLIDDEYSDPLKFRSNPSDTFNTSDITNNLGFQFLIAITIFSIVYGLGNYVFNTVPNEVLKKKLEKL